MTAMIDAEGCDSAKIVPPLNRYFEISEWDRAKPFSAAAFVACLAADYQGGFAI
jgi:hypothetical protein